MLVDLNRWNGTGRDRRSRGYASDRNSDDGSEDDGVAMTLDGLLYLAIQRRQSLDEDDRARRQVPSSRPFIRLLPLDAVLAGKTLGDRLLTVAEDVGAEWRCRAIAGEVDEDRLMLPIIVGGSIVNAVAEVTVAPVRSLKPAPTGRSRRPRAVETRGLSSFSAIYHGPKKTCHNLSRIVGRILPAWEASI
jgi:hypothetical protein